jgi:hypothetical protein
VVQNKAGASGAEGLLDIKSTPGDAHRLVVSSSGLYTVPLATGLRFNWRDLTPVAMVAQDEFILWVNSDTPYKTPLDYLAEVKKEPSTFKMGGTSSKREDHIITAMVEKEGGRQVRVHPVQGRRRGGHPAVGQAYRFEPEQPVRIDRAVARRTAPRAVPVCRQAQHLHRKGHRDPELGRHPDLQGKGPGRAVPDAARLHVAGQGAAPEVPSTTPT